MCFSIHDQEANVAFDVMTNYDIFGDDGFVSSRSNNVCDNVEKRLQEKLRTRALD